jgi:chemotaxis protein CheD
MDLAHRDNYYLEPGGIYFTKVGAAIRSVVGSCVAVCLWDKTLKYGGMNHFLHPWIGDASRATPQYGNVATAALVRIMEESGCRRNELVAHVVGGSHPEDISDHRGADENVRIARAVLARKGITILSEDVGGTIGRKVVFDTSTGHLAVLKVHRLRAGDWLT